jgi:ABC-2 type transport system permease protein
VSRHGYLITQTRVAFALAGRGLRVQLRRAQFLVPSFMLPLVLLGIIASGTSSATQLRGFPDTGAFIGFVVGGTIVQGTLFAGLTGGIAMASDIEGGFMDRLMAAPVSRIALVFGRILGASVVGAFQVLVFLGVAFIFGARYEGGIIGIAEVVVLASVSAGAVAGLASAIALRTGSMQLMQNLFPIMFVLLFTAPAFFPREFLNPALESVAPYNPLTYVVEGIRAAMHDNPALGSPLHGLLAAVGFLVASTALAVMAMRSRVRAS